MPYTATSPVLLCHGRVAVLVSRNDPCLVLAAIDGVDLQEFCPTGNPHVALVGLVIVQPESFQGIKRAVIVLMIVLINLRPVLGGLGILLLGLGAALVIRKRKKKNV